MVSTPGRAIEINLSDGVEGVRETLYLMSRIVKQYKNHPFILTSARLALNTLPGKQWRAEADALCRYVQRSVRYVQDSTDTEVLILPDVLLREVHAGDCDDMALVLACLLESVGHKTRFVACGFTYDPPGELTHVFVQTRIGGFQSRNGGWYSLDPSESEPPGWEPPDVARCFTVHN